MPSHSQSENSPTALCMCDINRSELLPDENMLTKGELYIEPGHTCWKYSEHKEMNKMIGTDKI